MIEMRFDEMDKKMRVYEQSLDQVLLPDIYMVARLDGRGFTRLTNRNALNSHCYWMLRKEGTSVHKATSELKGKGVAYKNELLFSRGINYDKLPSWQKRGVGMWIEEYGKEGFNPLTGETKMTTRKRIHVDYELPLGDEYGSFIRKFT